MLPWNKKFLEHQDNIKPKTILSGSDGQDIKEVAREIAKAFISAYEEQAQSLFDSYLDNAECYTTKSKVKNKITREESEPDEKFMRSIEEMIGVVGSARD